MPKMRGRTKRRRVYRGKRRHYKSNGERGVVLRSVNNPVPRFLETTLQCVVSGQTAATNFTAAQTTSQTGYAMVGIPMWPSAPFNTSFGTYPVTVGTNKLIVTASSTLSACSWKNWLYNTTTNTGLYDSFVPLSAQLDFEFNPVAAADNAVIGICPVTSIDPQFSANTVGVSTLMQSPKSVTKMIMVNDPNPRVSCRVSLPKLFGVTKKIMCEEGNYAGTYLSPPTIAGAFVVAVQLDSQAQSAAITHYRIKLRVRGRFMTPAQAALNDV